MDKIGIDNLKKVVGVVAALANMGDKIGHETGIARWSELLGLVTILHDAGSIEFAQVMPEVKDLDADERAVLMALFDDSLKLVDGNLEGVIEQGLGIVEDLVALIERSITLAKSIKA